MKNKLESPKIYPIPAARQDEEVKLEETATKLRSTGRASITGFAEVKDVVSVCKWVCSNADLSVGRILLVGSSAGAPISGSSVDQVEHVVGYNILQSPKPKLFVMGTRDGFTSVKQLKSKLKGAAGRVDTHLIEGSGHFQMEGPEYDTQMEINQVPFPASRSCCLLNAPSRVSTP
ncbi:hypothetical protein SAY87_015689 [Trapa incisa]|uniref:Uncharacterized protein n=1 Tax=Trapa incisa TaxID=236973 RepID=A0AAN7QY94_9MYRT|nr:hypothetical protein SAY87_015689 [Trapa incisa]